MPRGPSSRTPKDSPGWRQASLAPPKFGGLRVWGSESAEDEDVPIGDGEQPQRGRPSNSIRRTEDAPRTTTLRSWKPGRWTAPSCVRSGGNRTRPLQARGFSGTKLRPPPQTAARWDLLLAPAGGCTHSSSRNSLCPHSTGLQPESPFLRNHHKSPPPLKPPLTLPGRPTDEPITSQWGPTLGLFQLPQQINDCLLSNPPPTTPNGQHWLGMGVPVSLNPASTLNNH